MLAATLSRAEGASEVLHGGFVTYTKAHKAMGLGVSARVLREQGAVNEDVACQLASGALERSPASIAVAITGVLGPEEDEDGNPVGRVYICARRRSGKPTVAHKEFGKMPRERMCMTIMAHAIDLIEDVVRAS